MNSFNIEFDQATRTLTVGFGEPADNDAICKDASATLREIEAAGGFYGQILKVTGRMSIPVAMVIAHKVAHLFGAIAVFDPKLSKFVVVITHHPDYKLGQLIEP